MQRTCYLEYVFHVLASLSDTGKFQYNVGNTYTYAYEGTTETKLQGSSQQTTSLKIQSTADIEVISKCEFALKVIFAILSVYLYMFILSNFCHTFIFICICLHHPPGIYSGISK